MSYFIENIFICLAAPFLIAAVILGRGKKSYIFIVSGMLACIVSAYLNTFFSSLYNAGSIAATMEITPVIEETVKLLPLIFYIAVFEPDSGSAAEAAVHTAVGFATFENICCLLQNGTDNLFYLLVRGCSTGAMHIVCAFITGYGLKLAEKMPKIMAASVAGLLCMAITYHAVFNMLMGAGGAVAYVGYAVPLATLAAGTAARRHLRDKI